jgi:hypothetical protein
MRLRRHLGVTSDVPDKARVKSDCKCGEQRYDSPSPAICGRALRDKTGYRNFRPRQRNSAKTSPAGRETAVAAEVVSERETTHAYYGSGVARGTALPYG